MWAAFDDARAPAGDDLLQLALAAATASDGSSTPSALDGDDDNDGDDALLARFLVLDGGSRDSAAGADDASSSTEGARMKDIRIDEANVVSVVELPSRGLAFKLWPAAVALCLYLCREARTEVVGKRCLELGAGTGFVGILAAKLGASRAEITDLPFVVENMQRNIRANGFAADNQRVGASALSWGDEQEMDAAVKAGYDVILASDVVYNENLYDLLLETLVYLTRSEKGCSLSAQASEASEADLDASSSSSSRSSTASSSSVISNPVARSTSNARPQPIVLLGHLRRWKKDSRFFKRLAKYFHVQPVFEHAFEGVRRSAFVYRLVRK